jgi:hypothetical protein
MAFHLASLYRPTLCAARCASRRPPPHRALSSTSRVSADAEAEQAASDEFNLADVAQPESEGPAAPTTYNEFLNQVAWRYKNAEPQNWLSPKAVSPFSVYRIECPLIVIHQPFPMNPSFRPPPPISDSQREKMYREYVADPDYNSVRALSQRYNLSLKRVDAILRLKGMERAWKKVRQSSSHLHLFL